MTRRTSSKRKQKRKTHNIDNNFSESAPPRKRGKHSDDTVVEINPQNQHLNQVFSTHRSNQALQAKTLAQENYIKAIRQHCLTLGLGPAGTGKSYCAAALAGEALESGKIERIILTRPAVEAGEQLGFLPGSVDEKFAVYIDAFRDILNERLGAGTVNYCIRHGRIVAAPLAFMRGKTFDENTFVILDEAQNTSPAQMKMFLTRIGEDCKVVINGDIRQSDIRGPNGLSDAVDKLKGLSGVYIHHFDYGDIVRSGLVKSIIDRYEPQVLNSP